MARRDDRRAAERLSHLQIVALAGEFYAETVAAHRDEPGAKAVWEDLVTALHRRQFGSDAARVFDPDGYVGKIRVEAPDRGQQAHLVQ